MSEPTVIAGPGLGVGGVARLFPEATDWAGTLEFVYGEDANAGGDVVTVTFGTPFLFNGVNLERDGKCWDVKTNYLEVPKTDGCWGGSGWTDGHAFAVSDRWSGDDVDNPRRPAAGDRFVMRYRLVEQQPYEPQIIAWPAGDPTIVPGPGLGVGGKARLIPSSRSSSGVSHGNGIIEVTYGDEIPERGALFHFLFSGPLREPPPIMVGRSNQIEVASSILDISSGPIDATCVGFRMFAGPGNADLGPGQVATCEYLAGELSGSVSTAGSTRPPFCDCPLDEKCSTRGD